MLISTAEAAELLGVSVRRVQLDAKSGKYVAQRSSSGARAKYEIALDSLPREAQERYWENIRLAQAVEAAKPKRGRPSKAAIRKAEAEAEEVKANEEYLAAPKWQKDAVDNRLYIVEQTV